MKGGLRHAVCAVAAAVVVLAALGFAATGGAAIVPAGFADERVVAGLNLPTGFALLPDGRVLVAQKGGVVRVVKNGQLLATPFLDISAKTNTSNDRGLLGIAAHPNFASNGWVYLFYVHEHTPGVNPTQAKTSRVIRVTANGDVAAAGSETVILGSRVGAGCAGAPVGSDCLPADYQGHNGGDLEFGSDGRLWVAVGDSASPNNVDDRALRAQNLDSLAGKILHVTDTGAGLSANPFWNGDAAHARSKIWAYGVRNPFRFGLKPGTNVPFVGDVGWNDWEEVDVATAGANLGWPCYEGNARQSGYEPKPVCQTLYGQGASAVKAPLVAYAHTLGRSVTGGAFYTGTAFPAQYQGAYFYGDYTGAWIRYLKVDANNALTQQPTLFASAVEGPVDIEVGPDGALYYLAINTGELRRIRYTAGNAPPNATATATPTSGVAPLDVQFSSAGSSDPNGDPLTYSWNFGDGSPLSTAANPIHRYTANGTYTATLTVSDGQGGTGTATVAITVGNRAPTATITSPVSTFLYRIGTPISLQGSATDPEDASIPSANYSWSVTLKHCPDGVCHDHPYFTATGASASMPVDDHGDDVHFEISLTVRDSGGLTDTETVTVHPRTVQLTLASNPAGFNLVYDGRTVTAPFTKTTPAGSTHTISAPSPQGSATFASWSDGGAQQHNVTLGDTNATYTATFSGGPPPGGTWAGFVTDPGCAACSAVVTNDVLQASVGGGADTVDTAYGWRDFGAQTGRVYVRDVLRLENGFTPAADLILFQSLDGADRLVYQLSLNTSRRLALYSPAGGLRAASFSAVLDVIPNDGSEARIEASALRNDSIIVRVNGIDRYTLTGLSGATTTDQRYVRAGIIRYGGSSTNAPVTTWHRAVATSTSGWLGDPGGGGGDTTPPAAPTGLTATGSTSGITLDWTDSPEPDLAGYHVERAGSPGGPFSRLTASPLTLSAYDDATAPAGETSYYRVIAVDASGNESSPATTSAPRPGSGGGDTWNGFVTDAGCGACFAAVVDGALETHIGGGADSVDSAYAWRDFGAVTGRLYARDILRLPAGQAVNADLILFQVLDSGNRLVYQLSLNPSRQLVLYSPAGGLRATSVSAVLGVTIPNDGSETRIEVSALRNSSVIVRVDGTDRYTLTGLTGATTTDQRYLRAGLIRYGGTTTDEPVASWHRAVTTSTTGWLGAA